MIPPRAIQVWEQHAGGRPILHAWTDDLDALPGIQQAWLSQFADRCVGLRWSNVDVLVCEMEWVGSAFDGRPVATLWVEYPDHLLADMVSRRLDARWRGPARGASLDTRDGTRRRVSR